MQSSDIHNQRPTPPGRRLRSVDYTCETLGISKATFWRRKDLFKLVRIGSRTLVDNESIDRVVEEGLP
jgi:hypothetical protein